MKVLQADVGNGRWKKQGQKQMQIPSTVQKSNGARDDNTSVGACGQGMTGLLSEIRTTG